MSTELATTGGNIKDKTVGAKQFLDKIQSQVARALPKHLNADTMMRIAFTAMQRVPRLLECTQQSLAGAIMQASQLGLKLDGHLGEAYLIPFKNNKKGIYEAQFIPGYQGLMRLARRSGEVTRIEAHVVRKGDFFDYWYGSDPQIKHKPALTPEICEIDYAYAVAWVKDGTEKGHQQFEVMSTAQVEKIRERSKSADDGPWVTDWAEMAKKTVIRRLCKMLPSSTDDLQRSVTLGELADANLPQDLDVPQDVQFEEEPKKTKLELATEKMRKEKTPEPDVVAAVVDPSICPSCGDAEGGCDVCSGPAVKG